jgi:alpha-ketoglutarate-dependent taurine dioxygenase
MSQANHRSGPGAARRKQVVVEEGLVRFAPRGSHPSDPLVIEPRVSGVALPEWAGAHREQVAALLLERRALLFRGFDVRSAETFKAVVEALSQEMLDYHEGSSPRTVISRHVYTSTEYPAGHRIFPHNELTYRLVFPRKIFFGCLQPATTRGETPVVDVRRVLAHIPTELRARFEAQGWMLVRNYGDGFGIRWQQAFGTEDRAVVDAYCRENGVLTDWKSGDRLRTRQVRRVVARHPQTGEALWFNHVAFFNITSIEEETARLLQRNFAVDELPTNTYFGDGSPIEPSVVEILREAYERELHDWPWLQGDVLLLDNMTMAHGRQPFTGPRRVLVSLADPIGWAQV